MSTKITFPQALGVVSSVVGIIIAVFMLIGLSTDGLHGMDHGEARLALALVAGTTVLGIVGASYLFYFFHNRGIDKGE